MYSNNAYSAPKGYDLRAPYNVPLGEVHLLRVVEPFSPSSRQHNTVTTLLPNYNITYPDGTPFFPSLNRNTRSYQVTRNNCTGQIQLGPEGTEPVAESTLIKLICKGQTIK